MSSSTVFQLTGLQKFFFAILRMAIGWHFLREGFVKLSQTHWSSYGYLANSWGPFSPYFKSLAESSVGPDAFYYFNWLPPLINGERELSWFQSLLQGSMFDGGFTFIQFNDVMIPWALTLAGIGLMFGIFTRLSSLVAIGLLTMFYISAPPWGEPTIPSPFIEGSEFTWMYYDTMLSNATWAGNQMIGAEGNYQIVNKNLIELFAVLALLTTNSGKYCGFDGLIGYYIFGTGKPKATKAADAASNTTPELKPATE